jgi:hypothetical protein
MKKIIAISIAICFKSPGRSQGLSNFFSQNDAAIKYSLAQIEELQTYIVYTEQGYGIAQKGLTVIGDFKKGEFDLHTEFFNSLKMVKPAVGGDPKVAAVFSCGLSIVGSFKKILQLKNMSVAESSYLQNVYMNICDACIKSLTQLFDIITDNVYRMKDNERIARIDKIYKDMKDRQAFTQSFASDAALLSLQRQQELDEIDLLKKLN